MRAHYIGIDAHQQSCTLAFLSPTGRRTKVLVVETQSTALREALQSVKGDRYVCLEEGEYSDWLYEILEPLAKEVIVVQPAKTQGTKSDAQDAFARADELRRGDLKQPIFKNPHRYRSLREAVRCHQMAVGDLVRTKNRLRSIFRSRGIQAPAPELYSCTQRPIWLEQLPQGVSRRAQILGDQLDRLLDSHEQAELWLLEEAGREPMVQLIATAPGIGIIRAAQIVAIVITPYRFRSSRQFWSYCGLGIVTKSSSDWVKDKKQGWIRTQLPQTRGLNRNRHPLMKNVFKGAAMTVIQQMPDNPLAQHYYRMLEQTKPNLARLTIARRLSATVLAMWKNKEVYDPEKQNRAQLR
jgi:transposase